MTTIRLKNFTKKEALSSMLKGLHSDLNRLDESIRQLQARIEGRLYCLPTGQPACPHHTTDYNSQCEVCQEITGAIPRKPKPRRKFSEDSKRRMSLAAKRRWRIRKRAPQKNGSKG